MASHKHYLNSYPIKELQKDLGSSLVECLLVLMISSVCLLAISHSLNRTHQLNKTLTKVNRAHQLRYDSQPDSNPDFAVLCASSNNLSISVKQCGDKLIFANYENAAEPNLP